MLKANIVDGCPKIEMEGTVVTITSDLVFLIHEMYNCFLADGKVNAAEMFKSIMLKEGIQSAFYNSEEIKEAIAEKRKEQMKAMLDAWLGAPNSNDISTADRSFADWFFGSDDEDDDEEGDE